VIEVRLQAVVVRRRADAILAAEARVPGCSGGDRGSPPEWTDQANGLGEQAERDRGQISPGLSVWAVPACQRSVPAPAVATASSGWMSTTRPTPARHAAPATIRETSGVAPSVNGTSSPASE
jgi:hypothetical protein